MIIIVRANKRRLKSASDEAIEPRQSPPHTIRWLRGCFATAFVLPLHKTTLESNSAEQIFTFPCSTYHIINAEPDWVCEWLISLLIECDAQVFIGSGIGKRLVPLFGFTRVNDEKISPWNANNLDVTSIMEASSAVCCQLGLLHELSAQTIAIARAIRWNALNELCFVTTTAKGMNWNGVVKRCFGDDKGLLTYYVIERKRKFSEK